MKYLLAGANGQLGYAFKNILESKKDTKLHAFGKEDFDITALDKVRDIVNEIKPDVVLNCAAYNAVDKAEEDWKTAYLVNGIGPRNLAVVCHEKNIPLVHYSTDYVFDGKKGSPYTIADEPNPINEYGKSKLLGEKFVQSLCNKYLLIRTSWVFGPGGKPGSNFVDKILKWAEEREHLKIVDDQVSSPTYTFDLANATLALLNEKTCGLYHITNSGSCSRYEWAKYVLESIGWKGNLDTAKSCEFETKAERPLLSCLNTFPLNLCPNWRISTFTCLTFNSHEFQKDYGGITSLHV